MSAVVVRSRVQDVKTRAIRAHDLFAGNAQKDPWVAQRAVTAIAGDGARSTWMISVGVTWFPVVAEAGVEAAPSGMLILCLVGEVAR